MYLVTLSVTAADTPRAVPLPPPLGFDADDELLQAAASRSAEAESASTPSIWRRLCRLELVMRTSLVLLLRRGPSPGLVARDPKQACGRLRAQAPSRRSHVGVPYNGIGATIKWKLRASVMRRQGVGRLDLASGRNALGTASATVRPPPSMLPRRRAGSANGDSRGAAVEPACSPCCYQRGCRAPVTVRRCRRERTGPDLRGRPSSPSCMSTGP